MSEIARFRAFVLWFINEPKQELGTPAPWSVELAGNVIDPRVDDAQTEVRTPASLLYQNLDMHAA